MPQVDVSTSDVTPQYGWNPTAGRYVDLSTGRFVAFTEVRAALEYNIQASNLEIERITQALLNGQISLDAWQTSMMEQIKIAHINAACAARGGWAQMTPADWGFVGRQIRTQYDFLRNFVNDIQTGKQALNGKLLIRAGMYGDASRSMFEDMRRRVEELVYGMEEEMRVLGVADHCPDCLDNAGKWAPIGTLPRIGESVCRTRCHCRFRFRKKNPNGGFEYRG